MNHTTRPECPGLGDELGMRDRDSRSSQAREGCSSLPMLVFAAASRRGISLTAARSHANHPWTATKRGRRWSLLAVYSPLWVPGWRRVSPRRGRKRRLMDPPPLRRGRTSRLVGCPMMSRGAHEDVDSFTNTRTAPRTREFRAYKRGEKCFPEYLR